MPLSTLPPKWRIVLAVSLAVNLLIAGSIAGHLLRQDDTRPRGVPLISALPDDDRSVVRDSLSHRDRSERRERFMDLLSTLRADPFEADAVRSALARQRQLGNDGAARVEAALVARLEAMSPQARAAYADRLESEVRGGRRR